MNIILKLSLAVGASLAGALALNAACPSRDHRLQAPPSGSSAYVVAANHPGGCSDSGPGSEEQPWCTIQNAANRVAPGNFVLVKSGVYEESVEIRQSGTPEQRIVFLSEPPHSVEMRGFRVFGSYVRIEGFRIRLDGTSFSNARYAILGEGDGIEIVNNDIREVRAFGIYCNGVSNYLARNRLYQVQMGIWVNGDGWLVEHNEVERLYNYGGLGDADYMRFFGTNGVIRDNHFHGTDFDEIGNAHVDCFQTFDDYYSIRNILIERNDCSEFGQGIMAESTSKDASSDLIVRNNLFVHGRAWGLSIHDIDNVTAYNNTFFDIGHIGIGLRDSAENGLVFNNIFSSITQSYVLDHPSSKGDYNLIHDARPVMDPNGRHDLVGQEPLFVDPDQRDYRLQSLSPAIDAGDDVTSLHFDLECNPRPHGAGWDIGAFEFSGSVPRPNPPSGLRVISSQLGFNDGSDTGKLE